MKRIRVTVTEEYLLPDDWKVMDHPDDKISCLRGDNHDFLPDLQWAQHRLHVPPNNAPEPHGTWIDVDSVRADWFNAQLQESGAEFRELD